MRERRVRKFRPGLERLEQKRPLSASAAVSAAGHPAKVENPPALPHPGEPVPAGVGAQKAAPIVSAASVAKKPETGFLVYRITNPNKFNNKLTPPFSHVLVQSNQPVAGQVYNVLYVAVRNGTAQTFDANSNFQVKFPNDKTIYPILTGDQQWKPGQEFVFYVLTKKYYPLPSQVHSGFEFSLAGARSIGIPGPSGIYQRVKYDPATFGKTLDWIVAFGPGAQGGKGIKFGLPDTAIYEFLSSKTRRNDFSGYF